MKHLFVSTLHLTFYDNFYSLAHLLCNFSIFLKQNGFKLTFDGIVISNIFERFFCLVGVVVVVFFLGTINRGTSTNARMCVCNVVISRGMTSYTYINICKFSKGVHAQNYSFVQNLTMFFYRHFVSAISFSMWYV